MVAYVRDGIAAALAAEPCDLAALVGQVVAAARATAPEHRLVVRAASCPPLLADPLRLEQVLTNLLDNAVGFSPAGSAIEVELAAEAEAVVLAVRDHGPGVSALRECGMATAPEIAGPALGIDFGERRIGVALSDPERRLAVPWGVVERQSDRQAIGELAALARAEGVALLVAGEPRGLGGEAGEAARRARRFAERLARAARLPLVLVDEALTSDEAGRRLAEAGLDRRARRGRIDAVAAQILLQEALDRGLAPPPAASPASGPPSRPKAGAAAPDPSEKR